MARSSALARTRPGLRCYSTNRRLSELLGLDAGSIDRRKGERPSRWPATAPKVASCQSKPRSRPSSTTTCGPASCTFATGKLVPSFPLFVYRHGTATTPSVAVPCTPVLRLGRGGSPRPDGAPVHALRPSMATRLAEDGASATEIHDILGHESLKTSQAHIDATQNE